MERGMGGWGWGVDMRRVDERMGTRCQVCSVDVDHRYEKEYLLRIEELERMQFMRGRQPVSGEGAANDWLTMHAAVVE